MAADGRADGAAGAARGLVGIHVVRRAAQAEALRALGAEHVLVSSDADFTDRLAARCRDLRATIAFDAVAGDITGQLVEALPDGGEVVVYGALSAQPCGAIDPMVLAFQHKSVRGFEIAGHLETIGLIGSFRLATAAQKLIVSGVASTQVRERVKLAEGPAKLADYVRSMSEGKVLLTP